MSHVYVYRVITPAGNVKKHERRLLTRGVAERFSGFSIILSTIFKCVITLLTHKISFSIDIISRI